MPISKRMYINALIEAYTDKPIPHANFKGKFKKRVLDLARFNLNIDFTPEEVQAIKDAINKFNPAAYKNPTEDFQHLPNYIQFLRTISAIVQTHDPLFRTEQLEKLYIEINDTLAKSLDIQLASTKALVKKLEKMRTNAKQDPENAKNTQIALYNLHARMLYVLQAIMIASGGLKDIKPLANFLSETSLNSATVEILQGLNFTNYNDLPMHLIRVRDALAQKLKKPSVYSVANNKLLGELDTLIDLSLIARNQFMISMQPESTLKTGLAIGIYSGTFNKLQSKIGSSQEPLGTQILNAALSIDHDPNQNVSLLNAIQTEILKAFEDNNDSEELSFAQTLLLLQNITEVANKHIVTPISMFEALRNQLIYDQCITIHRLSEQIYKAKNSKKADPNQIKSLHLSLQSTVKQLIDGVLLNTQSLDYDKRMLIDDALQQILVFVDLKIDSKESAERVSKTIPFLYTYCKQVRDNLAGLDPYISSAIPLALESAADAFMARVELAVREYTSESEKVVIPEDFVSKSIYEFEQPPILLQWTDCEGDWDKVERAIRAMNAYLKKIGIQEEITLERANAETGAKEYIKIPEIAGRPIILNFGGDATDAGNSDIRIKHLLFNTKIKQPDNVNINIGNRDMLNLRFAEELPIIEKILLDNAMPTWLSRDKKVTFGEFILKQHLHDRNFHLDLNQFPELRRIQQKDPKSLSTQDMETIQDWVSVAENRQKLAAAIARIPTDQLEFQYIQWADTHTMTRPDRIFFRRQELARKKAIDGVQNSPTVLKQINDYNSEVKQLKLELALLQKCINDIISAKPEEQDAAMEKYLDQALSFADAHIQEDRTNNAFLRKTGSLAYELLATVNDPNENHHEIYTKLSNEFSKINKDVIKEKTEKLDKELSNYITDTEIVNDIKSSVRPDGIDYALLKVSNAVAKIGSKASGYISTLHGAPSDETIKGVTDYDVWLMRENEAVQRAIDDVVFNPSEHADINSSNPVLAYVRYALSNGNPFPVGDSRNIPKGAGSQHTHTGTVISCQCFKEKTLVLSNQQTITQKVHSLDIAAIALALKASVYGFITGHTPTGSSGNGSRYVENHDGVLVSQVSTDTTYSSEGNLCVAAAAFGPGTIQQTVITLGKDTPEAKAQASFTQMPLIGKNAPTMPYNALMLGKNIFAPEKLTAESLKSGFDRNAKVAAWNIIHIENSKENNSGEIISITLQRMSGDRTSEEITFKNITAQELRTLAQYSAISILKEKPKDAPDSSFISTTNTTIAVNTRALAKLTDVLQQISEEFGSEWQALAKEISGRLSKEVQVQNLETTLLLRKHILGLQSLLNAEKHHLSLRDRFDNKVKKIEALQRILASAPVALPTELEQNLPNNFALMQEFFLEYKHQAAAGLGYMQVDNPQAAAEDTAKKVVERLITRLEKDAIANPLYSADPFFTAHSKIHYILYLELEPYQQELKRVQASVENKIQTLQGEIDAIIESSIGQGKIKSVQESLEAIMKKTIREEQIKTLQNILASERTKMVPLEKMLTQIDRIASIAAHNTTQSPAQAISDKILKLEEIANLTKNFDENGTIQLTVQLAIEQLITVLTAQVNSATAKLKAVSEPGFINAIDREKAIEQFNQAQQDLNALVKVLKTLELKRQPETDYIPLTISKNKETGKIDVTNGVKNAYKNIISAISDTFGQLSAHGKYTSNFGAEFSITRHAEFFKNKSSEIIEPHRLALLAAVEAAHGLQAAKEQLALTENPTASILRTATSYANKTTLGMQNKPIEFGEGLTIALRQLAILKSAIVNYVPVPGDEPELISKANVAIHNLVKNYNEEIPEQKFNLIHLASELLQHGAVLQSLNAQAKKFPGMDTGVLQLLKLKDQEIDIKASRAMQVELYKEALSIAKIFANMKEVDPSFAFNAEIRSLMLLLDPEAKNDNNLDNFLNNTEKGKNLGLLVEQVEYDDAIISNAPEGQSEFLQIMSPVVHSLMLINRLQHNIEAKSFALESRTISQAFKDMTATINEVIVKKLGNEDLTELIFEVLNPALTELNDSLGELTQAYQDSIARNHLYSELAPDNTMSVLREFIECTKNLETMGDINSKDNVFSKWLKARNALNHTYNELKNDFKAKTSHEGNMQNALLASLKTQIRFGEKIEESFLHNPDIDQIETVSLNTSFNGVDDLQIAQQNAALLQRILKSYDKKHSMLQEDGSARYVKTKGSTIFISDEENAIIQTAIETLNEINSKLLISKQNDPKIKLYPYQQNVYANPPTFEKYLQVMAAAFKAKFTRSNESRERGEFVNLEEQPERKPKRTFKSRLKKREKPARHPFAILPAAPITDVPAELQRIVSEAAALSRQNNAAAKNPSTFFKSENNTAPIQLLGIQRERFFKLKHDLDAVTVGNINSQILHTHIAILNNYLNKDEPYSNQAIENINKTVILRKTDFDTNPFMQAYKQLLDSYLSMHKLENALISYAQKTGTKISKNNDTQNAGVYGYVSSVGQSIKAYLPSFGLPWSTQRHQVTTSYRNTQPSTNSAHPAAPTVPGTNSQNNASTFNLDDSALLKQFLGATPTRGTNFFSSMQDIGRYLSTNSPNNYMFTGNALYFTPDKNVTDFHETVPEFVLSKMTDDKTELNLSGTKNSWHKPIIGFLNTAGKHRMDFAFHEPTNDAANQFIQALLDIVDDFEQCRNSMEFTFETKETAEIIHAQLGKQEIEDINGNRYSDEKIKALRGFLKDAFVAHNLQDITDLPKVPPSRHPPV